MIGVKRILAVEDVLFCDGNQLEIFPLYILYLEVIYI